MPTADPPLAGVRVLITRPASRAAELIRRVRDAGGKPVAFPTLDIRPAPPTEEAIRELAGSDTVIFISANAVEYGYRTLQKVGESGKRILAVGPATKAALANAGCMNAIDPDGPANSEAVLEIPELRGTAALHVCIVRGQGGRERLKESLEARGHRVSYLECYRRCLPEHPDTGELVRVLDRDAEGLVVTATSATGLVNLLEMVPAAYRRRLVSRPLVVIGGRQKAEAMRNGWAGPVLESAAGDDHIVEAIAAWRGQP